jgi:hypothetical protein
VSRLVPEIPAERMTARARMYLLINVALHAAMAWSCLFVPEFFSSVSYTGVKAALPFGTGHALFIWGLLFLTTSVLSGLAAYRGSEYLARVSLLLSAICCASWTGGFLAALAAHQLKGPTGMIWSAALAAKDLIQLRQPLRNPFEPVMRRFEEAPDRDD